MYSCIYVTAIFVTTIYVTTSIAFLRDLGISVRPLAFYAAQGRSHRQNAIQTPNEALKPAKFVGRLKINY